jgi:hypothetical protein
LVDIYEEQINHQAEKKHQYTAKDTAANTLPLLYLYVLPGNGRRVRRRQHLKWHAIEVKRLAKALFQSGEAGYLMLKDDKSVNGGDQLVVVVFFALVDFLLDFPRFFKRTFLQLAAPLG